MSMTAMSAQVYVMLMDERATAETIAVYLFDVAANHMGLSANGDMAEKSAQTAKVLVALRPDFETH